MKYNKILVIGPSGAGKTFYSNELSRKLNIDVYHLDKLYWLPNWEKPNEEDWIKILKDIINKDSWILDGNYYRTLDLRLEKCDLVIYLRTNRFKCVRSIKKRVRLSNENKLVRDDLADGCIDKADKSLLKWSFSYNTKYAPVIDGIIKRYPNVKVVKFRRRKDAYKYIEVLENEQN